MSRFRLATWLVASGALSACSGAEERVRAVPASDHSAVAAPAGAQREPSRSNAAAETIVCDRVVDDFHAGAEGEFPMDWETHPPSSIELAKREGLYRVVTRNGRRALRARSGSTDFSLGRAIPDWDLATYPIVQWHWQTAALGPATGDDASQTGTVTVSGVWMIGFPFFVRRMGYTWSEEHPKGTTSGERFGYDRWLVVNSGWSGPPTWQVSRVNLLSDYRKYFGRRDSDAPTGLALNVARASGEANFEAYFADIRLCREHSAQ